MNANKMETLVLAACAEGSRKRDHTRLSDKELIALGSLRSAIWRLRNSSFDEFCRVDWAEFIPLMSEVFTEVYSRALASENDFERQALLLPAMYNLVYSPVMPDDDELLDSMDRMAHGFISRVISGDSVSWQGVHAAMNLCEATVCQWEGCEDEVEYQWFAKVAASWSDSIFGDEPAETLGRAVILQNAEMMEVRVIAQVVDKYSDLDSCEVVCTLAKLCLDSYECDSEMIERVTERLIGWGEDELPEADKWTLLAVVSEIAEVTL